MHYLAQQAGVKPDQLELVFAFRTVNNYIAFSIQTSDDIVNLWQRTLDEIKRDGTYKRVSKKYNYHYE
jgi:polar amino acid transport system substrate-binding protein